MSEQVILAWLRRIDDKLDRVAESQTRCQAKCGLQQVAVVHGRRRRAHLLKLAIGTAVAGAGALIERYLGG